MDHRNILMWIEKEGPKRRLRKYTTDSKKTRRGSEKSIFKQGASDQLCQYCVSLSKMRRNKSLLDLATFCGMSWSEAD